MIALRKNMVVSKTFNYGVTAYGEKTYKKIIELIVVSVAITSGIHFISTIIKNRYYGFLETIKNILKEQIIGGLLCQK